MNTQINTADIAQQRRHDRRLLEEWEHDTYKSKRKLSEPTVCPQCTAVYHKGRWQWGDTPDGAEHETCPACQRMQDKVPAGFLTLSGDFFAEHREEIIRAIRNLEENENAEHPLKRIMNIENQAEGVLITFTDPHLARGAGEVVQHAYKGQLDFTYQAEERLLRVTWTR